MAVGLDVGTSFIIKAREVEGSVEYTEFRDAFYRIKASTPVASKMIEKGLANRKYFKDSDGTFVVIGQDAIEKAIERHQTAARPMYRGVISPKEKDARRILKFILTELLGTPSEPGEKIVYSIPAQPIDQSDELFDTGYHEDVLSNDLREMGFTPESLNEAEAICYSELENDDYTGVSFSFGAGMVNVCVMSAGEAIIKYSTTRSGDWVDRMAAQSTAEPDSVIQVEKEGGGFKVGDEVPGSPILSAVSAYYVRLISYTTKYLQARVADTKELPKFSEPIPIIVGGGTSRAEGFLECFKEHLEKLKLPFEIKEVRTASDQMRAVSRGCLIASTL